MIEEVLCIEKFEQLSTHLACSADLIVFYNSIKYNPSKGAILGNLVDSFIHKTNKEFSLPAAAMGLSSS